MDTSLNIQSVGSVQQIQNFVNLYGRDFNELRFSSGWNRNTTIKCPILIEGQINKLLV